TNGPGGLTGSVLHSGGGVSNQSISLAGVVLSTNGTSGVILARWTFESATLSGSSTNSAMLKPEEGLQTNTAQAFSWHLGNSTYSTPAGNGSAKSFSCNTWNTNDFFQFNLSSAGYRGLKFKFDQTASGTGPLRFKLSYSIDGVNFVDVQNYDIPKTNNVPVGWNSTNLNSNSTLSFDLSSLSVLANKTNLSLRLVQRDTVSMTNGIVQSGGTCRVDNVEISGIALDTNPPVFTLSNGAVVTRVVGGVWIDPGVSAIDPEEGALIVVTNGTVNPGILGSYALDYSATDSSGNTGTATRTVNVVLNSSNSPSADTDGNGMPDLVEYALGGAVTGNSSSILPSSQITGTNLRISFLARTNDSNLVIRPVVSSNLVDTNGWSTNGVVKTAGVTTNNGFELQTWETPISGAVRKFLKINITR
ncbi:MAG: DUF5011 domain-containing protein, partial [Verrucomicrobia bacterium]|nr:DUF5011 domain-containing protein [Verrucomicrobiota bacterium]